MRYKLAILSLALLAGSSELATGQAKAPAPPDPGTVKRLQDSIAKAEAKGDLRQAQSDLRYLLVVYRNDPAMQTSIRAQLAQVSAQIDSKAKASPAPTPAPAPAPALNPSTAASAAPVPAPTTVAPVASSATAASAAGLELESKQIFAVHAEGSRDRGQGQRDAGPESSRERPDKSCRPCAAQSLPNRARRRFRFLDTTGA
jgi:hypothetical protein